MFRMIVERMRSASRTWSTDPETDDARGRADARPRPGRAAPPRPVATVAAVAAIGLPARRRRRRRGLGRDDRRRRLRRTCGCRRDAVLRLTDLDGDACVQLWSVQRAPARRAAQRGRHREGAVAGLPRRRRAAAVGHGPGADDDRRRHQRSARRAVRQRRTGRPTRRATATARSHGRDPERPRPARARAAKHGLVRRDVGAERQPVQGGARRRRRRAAPSTATAGRGTARRAARRARRDRARGQHARTPSTTAPDYTATRSCASRPGARAGPDRPRSGDRPAPSAERAFENTDDYLARRRTGERRSPSSTRWSPARAPWAGGRARRADRCASSTSAATRRSTACSTTPHDPAERYSAPDTIAAQRNIFLVAGTRAALQRGRRR